MKRVVCVLVLLAAAEARAEPEAPEAWIGTWTGKARWKDCTIEGPATLSIAITWRDGALAIDGAAIYDGLGELVPEVRAGGALVHDGDDVDLTLAKGKLTFATPTCAMTAKLRRAGTGVDACDRLAALEVVADACGVAPTADDEARPTRAKQCARRARDLRARLVADACLPPAKDLSTLPACREVWTQAARIQRCDHAPVSFKQQTLRSVGELRRSLWPLGARDGGAEYAETSCHESAAIYRDMADALHCP